MGKMPKIHLHPAHNRDSALAAGAKRRDEGRVATVVDEGGRRRSSVGRQMLCKVPEVTFYFWVIKVRFQRLEAHYACPADGACLVHSKPVHELCT
jgi:hypothetical protein